MLVLPAPLGPEQPVDLAAPDLEVDAADRLQPAVGLAQVADGDRRCGPWSTRSAADRRPRRAGDERGRGRRRPAHQPRFHSGLLARALAASRRASLRFSRCPWSMLAQKMNVGKKRIRTKPAIVTTLSLVWP